MPVNEIRALSFKTIISELDLLKKVVIIQSNVWKEKICCCFQSNK